MSYTSFHGATRIAAGSLSLNAVAVRRALASGAPGAVLTFDDATGRLAEIDTRGSEADVLARYAQADAQAAEQTQAQAETPAPRGRGRPKLGVVAREVTLLPRHWEWLEAQPGGASTTLRRLVEEARRAGAGQDARRLAAERAYRVMNALAGDLPGFEEASRALFADDAAQFGRRSSAWPPDLRDYLIRLAFGDERKETQA
jgi:hypothetical protein